MYQTITRSMFHDAFNDMGRKDQFSYEALNALYDHLIDYEESHKQQIELDVIALCCDFAEEDIEDVLISYNLESLDELHDNTMVIWHNDTTVLYQLF